MVKGKAVYKLTIRGRKQASELEKSRIHRLFVLTRYAVLQFLKKKGMATSQQIESAVIAHKVRFPIDSDFVMAVVSTRGGVLSIARGVAREIRLMIKKGYIIKV